MSDSNVTETTETVETVAAPKFDYSMIALRSKLNAHSPKSNVNFEAGMTLYVTQKPNSGSVRIAQSSHDLGLVVGQTANFDHDTRKGSYGNLTVIGIVSADGTHSGDVPNRGLALREIVATIAE